MSFAPVTIDRGLRGATIAAVRILTVAMMIASLAAASLAQETRPARRPAPRWLDGTINLGAPAGQTGMWDGGEPLTTIPSATTSR